MIKILTIFAPILLLAMPATAANVTKIEIHGVVFDQSPGPDGSSHAGKNSTRECGTKAAWVLGVVCNSRSCYDCLLCAKEERLIYPTFTLGYDNSQKHP